MEEIKANLPEDAKKITVPVVKSVFNLELAAKNYQKLLQQAEGIVFTKENLNEDYSCLKELRGMVTFLKDSKEAKKRPHLDANSNIEDAYKEVLAPIKEILDRKLEEFKKVNDNVKAENAKIEQEKQRQAEIQQKITAFINETTASITNALTDAEIVSIQKAIGSEKSRSTYYAEYLSDLKTACDNLTPLVNERKEVIRKADKLKGDLESEDIIKATKAKQELEDLEIEMQENTIRIQEKAFEQAANIPVVIGESTTDAIKGRTNWKWEVVDIDLLHKKMKHLTEIVPDKDAINDLLKTKKADGSLKGKTEDLFFGIRFYNAEGF